jgi:hypothetical protein
VLQFVVQLEVEQEGAWMPVIRYDNAHGFCHRDDFCRLQETHTR